MSTSKPNKCGETFRVGDGVHWGYGGDSYPGTVRRVSESGRKVWVSHDRARLLPGNEAYSYDAARAVFEPLDAPESEWKCFTLYKHGHFTERPGRFRGSRLTPGRETRTNPER